MDHFYSVWLLRVSRGIYGVVRGDITLTGQSYNLITGPESPLRIMAFVSTLKIQLHFVWLCMWCRYKRERSEKSFSLRDTHAYFHLLSPWNCSTPYSSISPLLHPSLSTKSLLTLVPRWHISHMELNRFLCSPVGWGESGLILWEVKEKQVEETVWSRPVDMTAKHGKTKIFDGNHKRQQVDVSSVGAGMVFFPLKVSGSPNSLTPTIHPCTHLQQSYSSNPTLEVSSWGR